MFFSSVGGGQGDGPGNAKSKVTNTCVGSVRSALFPDTSVAVGWEGGQVERIAGSKRKGVCRETQPRCVAALFFRKVSGEAGAGGRVGCKAQRDVSRP